MFVGEYTHTIDDKNRLTIPAKFRAAFEVGLFVTIGPEQCLWVFSRDEWERFSQSITDLPVGNDSARKLGRLLFSHAMDAIPDRQGRIILPDNLKQYATLDGTATLIGVGNKVEIWQPDRWEDQKTEQLDNLADLTDALQALGF